MAEIIAAYKSNNSSGSNNKGLTVLEPNSDLTFQLLKIALKNKEGQISDHYEHEEHIKVEIDFRISKQLPNYYLHFNITNVEEIVVYVATDEELSENYHAGTLAPGDYQYSFELPKSLLKPGKYNVNLSFCNQFYPQVQTCPDILSFEIIDTTTTRGRKQLYRRDAVVAPDIEWSFRKI